MNLFKYLEETEGLENSLNFSIKHGILPNKDCKDCIKCGKAEALKWTTDNRVTNIPFKFVCSDKQCRATISIGRNSAFHHLPFSLSKALRLIYFWILKISIQDCANQLELPENSVSDWFQFFREVCAFIIINYTEAVGGPGHIIDICEYQLQTKEDSYDLWIFTGIDRNRGNNFAIHVEDLDCDTIWPIIKNYILPGSVVVTPRFKEFLAKETNSQNDRLIFVHPNNYLRRQRGMHLDNMFNDMKQFVEKEISSNQQNCLELYAYQYLYFKRDIFCNKPSSELILPFLNDVKQVYPGFVKEKQPGMQRTQRKAK